MNSSAATFWGPVDGPLVALLPVAAVAPHPHGELRLRLLGAQRQAVAGVALALGLPRGLLQLLPALRRVLHADLGERLLVVAERPDAGDERDPELGPVELAVAGERLQEVRLDLRVEHVLRRVQQALVGVGDPVVDVEDVRQLPGLDHRVDLLVDVVPVDHLQLDVDAGVLLLEPADQVVPEALGLLAVGGGDHLDAAGRGLATTSPATLLVAARGKQQDEAEQPRKGVQLLAGISADIIERTC
jgi:hypothetical protein